MGPVSRDGQCQGSGNGFQLPQDRRFYFWEQGDVDAARRRLLAVTGHGLVRSGSSLIHGGSGGWIPIDHPNPLSWSYLIGLSTGGGTVLGLARAGNLLYAGTTNGDLFIFDITNPGAATQRGSRAPTVGGPR